MKDIDWADHDDGPLLPALPECSSDEMIRLATESLSVHEAIDLVLGAKPEGNIQLLQDVHSKLHKDVTYQRAGLYLGVTERHVRNLVRAGKPDTAPDQPSRPPALASIGRGQNKRVTVESLLRYRPPRAV